MRYCLFLFILIYASCTDTVVTDADTYYEDVGGPLVDTTSIILPDTAVIVPNEPSTNVLIDASHGGGVWWFPQGVNCNPSLNHQGFKFAKEISAHGYSVYETCREEVLDPNRYEDLALLVIADGYRAFSSEEVKLALDYLSEGGNVLLLMDHSSPWTNGTTWSSLGLEFFKTNVNDVVVRFESHDITNGVPTTLSTRGVSAISSDGVGIDVIAKLSSSTYLDLNYNGVLDANDRISPIFMGAISYGDGKLVFCGDVNLWQGNMTLLRNTMSWFGLD